MNQTADFSQSENSKLRQFRAYAESVATHAGASFLRQRPMPDGEGEVAVYEAYRDGLAYAGFLALADLEDQAKELGISMCRELAARDDFPLIGGDLSPVDFVDALYRDDRGLVEFWEKAPVLAEAAAFWQGMNDVYEFAVCFMNRATYQDDFRRIRATVEDSLRRERLLGVWKVATEIAYAEFKPTPSGGRIIPPQPSPGF